ncbi:MAG: hypothetical protein BWY70_01571 [Bacteroidetes bacterium ADurb.Bin408]|nr:MAG: hypothetical protein BWY70_01571 [Bacteroidetes bacterium ADurb.Bin408]
MIPYLCGIIENSPGSFFDYFFEGGIFKLSTCNQLVQVGNIGLVVLAIVKPYGFFRNKRFQGICRIR